MANYAARPSPQQIVSYLTGLGYNPVQAAAITGNIEQESGFNPMSLNKGEGAYGLLQWRGPRLTGLQQFAQSQGADPSDWRTQLDFMRYEMNNGEAKSATGFLNASSLPQANDSLKNYIRYGDSSEATRLSNAQNYLPSQYANFNQPALTPGSVATPLPPPINVASMPVAQPAGGLLGGQQQMAGLLGNPMQLANAGMGLMSGLGMSGKDDTPPPPQIFAPPYKPRVDVTPLVSLLSQPRPLGGASSWGLA